jgi:hypothetical protein
MRTGFSNYEFIKGYRPIDPLRGMQRYKAVIPE